MVSNSDLKRLARLAKLSILSENVDSLASDISDIVKVAQTIDDVDISRISNMGESEPQKMRDDVVMQSLSADAILKNAAHKRDGYFISSSGSMDVSGTADGGESE